MQTIQNDFQDLLEGGHFFLNGVEVEGSNNLVIPDTTSTDPSLSSSSSVSLSKKIDVATLSSTFREDWPTRRDYTAKAKSSEFNNQLFSFLLSTGLHYLNERLMYDLDNTELVSTIHDLEGMLFEVCMHRGYKDFFPDYDHNSAGSDKYHRISYSKLDEMIRDASEKVMLRWSSTYVSEAPARGRLGGLKSVRPPQYTPEHLRPFLGLSVAAQAQAVGCSTATVKRLRAQLRQETQK
ncbi:hypothetical protein [Rathayibacter caricis]|uniref:hypothetical protein n=1 Tax=Rathayibacter caricis TaxID=110936 RepID=UPI0011B23474|nr:hypothetical protein [Rathayibacter caricis]